MHEAIVTSIYNALDAIKGTRGGSRTREAEFITKVFMEAIEGAIVDHKYSERYVYDILGLRRPRRMAIATENADNEDGDIDADSDSNDDDTEDGDGDIDADSDSDALLGDHDSAEESDDGVLYELVDGALL